MSKQIPELDIIATPTAGQESIIETVVARHDTYATSRMTLAQIFTLGSISGSIKVALDALTTAIWANTTAITTKLNTIGWTRTGLTANRAIITDWTGVETYLTGTTTQVIGFDGAGKPIAINISSSTLSNSYTAWENISAWNAVYMNTDWLVYLAGTATTFLWFAKSTVSASQSVVVDINGITATQSWLSIWTKYYLVTSTPSWNTWANKTAMTTARYGLTASAVNSKIYCIWWTINSTQYLQTNEEYDPLLNTWASKANMTTWRQELRSSVYNNKIYCIGWSVTWWGYANHNEEYDPLLNTWASKANMTTARSSLSVVTYNNKIYCIGWYNGSNLATNEEYDPVANTWASKANMTTARQWLLSQQYNNKIYCIWWDNGAYLATNEEYDPVANTWASKTSMWTARYTPWSIQSGWFIYVFGWETTWVTRLATSEAYDVVWNTWSNKASMVNPRAYIWSWLVNWKAYIIWWYNWASWLSFNEEYTLPTTINSWTITTTPNSTKVWVATSSTSLLIQTNF